MVKICTSREVALDLDADIRRAVNAAAVAEITWLDRDGSPRAAPVTPLLLGDAPALAYPYAHATAARWIAAAPVATLLLSETRMTGGGWRPIAISGRPRLLADPAGERFVDELLAQELRKYPPARAFADSLLLRSENWWYLPRLIVTLEVSSVATIGPRTEGTGQVLAVSTGDTLYADTVDTGSAGADRVRVSSLTDRVPPDGPAVLFGHDFSVPDLEVWTPWTTRGQLGGGVLTVWERPQRIGLGPVPGLWERLRRHRDLERACRRGIAAATAS